MPEQENTGRPKQPTVKEAMQRIVDLEAKLSSALDLAAAQQDAGQPPDVENLGRLESELLAVKNAFNQIATRQPMTMEEIHDTRKAEVAEIMAQQPQPVQHDYRWQYQLLPINRNPVDPDGNPMPTMYPEPIEFTCPFKRGDDEDVIAFLNKSTKGSFHINSVILTYLGRNIEEKREAA